MPPLPDPDEAIPRSTPIEVDGTPYVLPTLDSMDLDEAMVLYRYSDLTFDAIFELEGLHPGVVAGLLHVAIQRSDPALREREIKEMVKRVNMMNVLEQLAALAEDQPDPTQGSAQPDEPDSQTSKPEATDSSGDAFDSSSEPSLGSANPDSSGTPDSGTSATSPHETSAVSLPTN